MRELARETLITPEVLEKLKEELEYLETDKRREVADRIKQAREGECDCRACRRSEIEYTSFFTHPRVERDIGVPGKRGILVAHNRDSADTQSLQVLEQGHELVRLATLRDENRDV